MTGPRFLGDKQVVGSFRSHQVPLPLAKTDTSQFEDLRRWLSSYNIQDLLVRAPTSAHNEGADPEGFFSKEVVRILPKRVERRMGMIKETYAGYEPLDVPDFKDYVNESGKDASPMKTLGGT
jgi:xylulose-5-phosphate/fructose-6-phosphate phosphoketolase